MKKFFISVVFLVCSLLLPGFSYSGIENTKHNLSADSGNVISAESETQICVFCHIPHNASPSAPLWNRADPGSTYIQYESSTVDATMGQPTGDSLLCLSCHDGTIALGDLLSTETPITMKNGVTTMPSGRSNLGTDLSDDHPVSFYYQDALDGGDTKLVNPASLTGAVKLDREGQLQCTSCHDPHDDTYGNFLVMNAVQGALCETCHVIFHPDTPHKNSTATWDGQGTDPWPNTEWTTVQDNACFNCHTPHAAAWPERLLKQATEEDVCLVCHNGHVAESDVDAAFQKQSKHPITNYLGEHDPIEAVLVSTRHVECQDCHNGHAVLTDTGDIDPSGTLNDVAGIGIDGFEIDPVTHEYQLCFRCHGDTQYQSADPILTSRLIAGTPNLRLDFQTSNPSYHPVAGIGANTNVPSLILPWSVDSIIKCTDCHNNNIETASTARGPHGSIYAPILERQYDTADNTAESLTAYALCYKCHDRNSILADQSFPKHSKHLSANVPCNACHAPHGVRPDASGQHDGTHLINFDKDIVTPNSSGFLYFEDTGDVSGNCYLTCHNKNHPPCNYRNCK